MVAFSSHLTPLSAVICRHLPYLPYLPYLPSPRLGAVWSPSVSPEAIDQDPSRGGQGQGGGVGIVIEYE